MCHSISKQDIATLIDTIKWYDKTESCFAYPFIRNAFLELDFAIPKCTIPAGKKFLRGRVHKNGEDFFREIHEISYNRDSFLIRDFGRANEPGQRMFYCSDYDLTSFVETCTTTREDTDRDFERITFGLWEATQDIDITYVIGLPETSSQNETLNFLTKEFLQFLEQMDKDERTAILALHEFISQSFQIEAHGHHALYKISCAYANWVFNRKTFRHFKNDTIMNIGGVMYKSALHPNEGMNIAFTSDAVDSSLKLVDVRRDDIVRKGNFYDGSNTIQAQSIDRINGKIVW